MAGYSGDTPYFGAPQISEAKLNSKGKVNFIITPIFETKPK